MIKMFSDILQVFLVMQMTFMCFSLNCLVFMSCKMSYKNSRTQRRLC